MQPTATPDIKAILFDFDGVIVHSEPLHCAAFLEVARLEGISLTEDEYYRDLIGYDDRGAWLAIFEMKQIAFDESRFQRILATKAQATRDLMARGEFHALPGVDEFITALNSHKIPLAICTGALRDEVETMLEGIQLRKAFDVIIAAEDVEVGKPDPRGYTLTASQLSAATGMTLHPDDCLIIEDAPTVAIRAREIGFNVLGVTTTYPKEHWPREIPTSPTLFPADVAKAFPSLAAAV